MTRWRLTIEYDGGPFMGWQRQDNARSVQGQIESAIFRMTGEKAVVHGAGRTDSGVHALAMSAHVDIEKHFTTHRLRDGLNALVRPDPIAILAASEVTDDWHARFSCIGRRYEYRLLNRRALPSIERGHIWHIPTPLDVEAMTASAAMLIGTHDFTTFRSAHCQ
ncbi:MAG: tRNA pseudouridine synthase A, partial [Sphingomicrobium sp.]